MTNVKTINLVSDFSDDPFGRDERDGPNSGERFREEFLKPAIREGYDLIVVDLNGASYGSSFLEEAFGGLLRSDEFSDCDLKNIFKIVHDLESYRHEVNEYLGG